MTPDMNREAKIDYYANKIKRNRKYAYVIIAIYLIVVVGAWLPMSYIYHLHVPQADQHTNDIVLNILMLGACIADAFIYANMIRGIAYKGTRSAINHLKRHDNDYEQTLPTLVAQAKYDWYHNDVMPIDDLSKLSPDQQDKFMQITVANPKVTKLYKRYSYLSAMYENVDGLSLI